jgi:hypothetical protein
MSGTRISGYFIVIRQKRIAAIQKPHCIYSPLLDRHIIRKGKMKKRPERQTTKTYGNYRQTSQCSVCSAE